MKTIAFLVQKGGAGKTTVAVHCAVAAQADGENVALVDTDPQGSAATWGAAREAATPVVAKATAQDLADVMTAARNDGMTYLMIDSAPHAAPSAGRVAMAADLIVIPVRPNAFDLAALPATIDIVKASGKPAVFVLSACPTRGADASEAADVLASYGFPVCSTYIYERRAYARAVVSGRAVAEFEPNGKAANEINNLWTWIKEQM